MSQFTNIDLQRELRRIGFDLAALDRFAPSGVPPLDDWVLWLRTLPTGTGRNTVFELLAKSPALIDAINTAKAAPTIADTAYADPELDKLQALGKEFKRVVPQRTEGDRPAPDVFGSILDVLRTLPDGAGTEAAARAMASSYRKQQPQ